jgi:hypothetical protein
MKWVEQMTGQGQQQQQAQKWWVGVPVSSVNCYKTLKAVPVTEGHYRKSIALTLHKDTSSSQERVVLCCLHPSLSGEPGHH